MRNGHKQFKSLADLTSDPNNARRHTPRNVGTIVDALHEVGAARSIVIDENGVVLAGNATMDAAIEAGLSKVQVVDADGETIIAVRRSGLTDKQKTRLALFDNRAAELAEWNPEVLAELIDTKELAGMFSDKELAEILSQTESETKDAEPQIDKAAELQQKWHVSTGEIITIGTHVLLCGDCTNREDMERLARGAKAQMLFTDPPYGVGYDGGHFHSGDVNIKRARPRLVADDSSEIYSQFLPVVLPHVDGPCYVWFADREGKAIFDAVAANTCEAHAMLVWNKTNATYAAMNAQYKQRHEPCLYFKPKGSTLRWVGPSDECTVWDVKRDASNEWHSTQKPIELSMRAMKNHAATSVLDVFAGSGSTMVGAQNLNRKAVCMEIVPANCSVILERMTTAFPSLKIERVDKAAAA